MQSPKIVIFDVDGVLLNSEGGIRAFQEMLDRKDLHWKRSLKEKITPMMLIRLLEGSDRPDTKENLKVLLSGLKQYMPSFISRIRLLKLGMKMGKTYEFQYSDFYPGVVEMLRELSKQGFYLGVCSNAESPRLITWIERKQIGDILKCWVTRDNELQYGLKPSGKPLLGTVERIQAIYRLSNIDKAKVVYIGDNVSDIKAGKDAGIKTIAVLSGHGYIDELVAANPTLILNVVTDLPAHLTEIFSD